MSRWWRMDMWGGLLLGLALALAVAATARAEEAPLRAILFWDRSCPNCEVVLGEVLPGIEARYGSRLQVVRAEVSSVLAYDKYDAALDHFQLPPERQGVPLLVLGDEVLLGRDEIAAGLAPAVDRALARGGAALPAALALTDAEIQSLEADSRAAWAGEHPTDGLANGAALAVLAFLGLALALVVALLWRAAARPAPAPAAVPGRGSSAWVPALAVAGLAVSGYLSWVKLAGSDTFCPIGRCEAVQHSPYAQLLGVPVAVLGFLTYALILGLWLWGRRGRGPGAGQATLAIAALAVFGTLYSAYLTYLELAVIGAVCVWCLASAVIIGALMVAAVRGALAELGGRLDRVRPADLDQAPA